MLDPELKPIVETVVRTLSTAARSLRLYPAASPIPRQSVEAALVPLAQFFEAQPTLPLTVAREGFTCKGTALSTGIGGAGDLADLLRSHGVAEVVFQPGCGADELLTFLSAAMRAPEDVRATGGFAAALSAGGVSNIRVVTVSLTVATQAEEPAEDEDVDDFFRELASDPDKLATWLAAASKGDPATLSEGLGELAGAAGPAGMDRFFDAFAQAFMKQENDGKDALLGIGMEPGGARDLVGGMLGKIGGVDISSSLTGGLFGKNMLSLSTALTHLPFGPRMDEIIAEVRASLPALGRAEREVDFLGHMVDVRTNPRPETALVQEDPTYRQVAAAASLDEATLLGSRAEVATSLAHTAARSVATMLALLDQQHDFGLYVKSLDNLAAIVPRLIRQGDLALAVTVLEEIAERENRTSQPWPELTQRLRSALSAATSRPAMSALLDAVLQDHARTHEAQEIIRLTDDGAKVAFVEEALVRRSDDALSVAEALLGRRMSDLLSAAAPRVGAGQLGPLVRRLIAAGDTHSMQALESILRRPDELSRVEAAEALSGSSSPLAGRLLINLLKDPSTKVVGGAARSLARSPLPGSAEAIGARLSELDVDSRDFALARDLIGSLAMMSVPAASEALQRLATRKTLIKRGHFAEVQKLARDALAAQSQRAQR